MAIKNYKPTTPSRRNMSVTVIFTLKGCILKNLFLSLSIRSQAVTLTEESQFVIVAAETEENIV